MKVFNKILIASSMVVTLGAAISCNNKQNNSGGVPYTYFSLESMELGDKFTVGFKYRGSDDIKVYWGIESTTPSKETSHTFECTDYHYLPVVRIEGNVSSIWFTDEEGKLIEKDNNQITTILFSNTITSIPKTACYGLTRLSTIFIPKSVKQVGVNAFFGPAFRYVFCAANGRPSGWDKNWATTSFVTEIVVWGVNYYIMNDNTAYVTYTLNQVNEAYYCGHLLPPNEEIQELEIPETVDINKVKYNVTSLLSVGAIYYTIEKITIHNNIKYIAPDAIAGCNKLTSVVFDGDFENLFLGEEIFSGCASLKSVVLPESIISLPRYLFEYCASLESVTIPSTVKWLDDEVFYECSANVDTLRIDVTGYKDADEIAQCYISPFDLSSPNHITFVYDNARVSVSDFVDKNWPDEGEQVFGPDIHWEGSSKVI